MTDDISNDELGQGDSAAGGGSEAETAGARRRFLTKGSVAVAAAAAGVVAMSDTAGAADEDAIQVGRATSGSGANSRTLLSDSALYINKTKGSTYNYAVRGDNTTGTGDEIGVLGEASGSSTTGIGVVGRSNGGTGVLGEALGSTASGTGVEGRATVVGVVGEGGSDTVKGTGVLGRSKIGASLKLDDSLLTLPLTGTWSAGSFVVVGGHAYYCWKGGGGATSKWVKISGAPIILDTGYRAYDSRAGRPPTTVTKGKLGNATTRTNIDLTVGGGGKLPVGISAVIVNLTAAETAPSGYMTAYKNGTTRPGTSSVNWTAQNSSIANTTIVPVDSASRISLYVVGGAHCLVDVIGFLP